MSKIGRNQRCPCGSGKKYKKCCGSKALDAPAKPTRAHAAPLGRPIDALPPMTWVPVELDIDKLSSSVLPLIREKHFDEALAVCERLRIEYPDAPDWLERSAMVHEARGDTALAIDFYRRSLAFTERPEQRGGFDEGIRDEFRDKIAKLNATLLSPQ